METLEQVESTAEPDEAPYGRQRPQLTTKRKVQYVVGAIAALGFIYWAFVEEKIRSTAITVVIAVAASAGLWIGLNLLFNQVRTRWVMFNTLAYATVGAVFGIVLHGNLLTVGSGDGFFAWVLGPLAGAAALGAVGFLLATNDDPARRRVIALVGFTAVGIGAGLLIRDTYHPEFDVLAMIIYTVVVGGIGAGLSVWMKHPPVNGALIGAALGWMLGAWGGADLGDGNVATSLIAAVVPAVLLGVRVGMAHNPDYVERVELETRSRAVIFIGPALLFISIMLVVPAIRTAYLSLLDRESDAWVALENYGSVFTDQDSLNLDNWANMFTSAPFLIGAGVVLLAIYIGIGQKRLTGKAVELGNPTFLPLVFGLLLLSFGVFTTLRGTLINNLWWVVVVTFASTALGLAIAVLADGRHGERVSKSIIFMPMAISLVGASVIWRFVYIARDPSTEQTGVMNALWVGLGNLSTGSGLPTLIFAVIFGLIFLGFVYLTVRMLTKYGWGRAAVPGVMAALTGWFFIRYIGLVGGGVGGFSVRDDGSTTGQAIFFIQDPPYNNFWLMVIFIWIQTGFAMVILSAAIKAVPGELIEAAKIDGATEAQVFWRVTLPQIATTIGVIVTTLIVGVMKVYDIVKVSTNGQFGTQVLANQMFQETFSFQDFGKGSALAMLIFFSVLPVMIINIRRMQRES